MIHAGAMTTGSARTDSVVGLYWMISASFVRLTTTPLVKATVFPGSNAVAASLRSLRNRRRRSAEKCMEPLTRLTPPSLRVCLSATGFVRRKLDGATVSSACRAMKLSNARWWRVAPCICDVASSHHRCVARKPSAYNANGQFLHSTAANRRSFAAAPLGAPPPRSSLGNDALACARAACLDSALSASAASDVPETMWLAAHVRKNRGGLRQTSEPGG